MYIPSWLIILGVFGSFFFFISLIVTWLKIPLVNYWSVPFAAILPWITVILMVAIWTSFIADESRSQAMAMSGLYPIFGAVIAWTIASLASFFLSDDYSFKDRIKWSLIVSGIPALSLAAFLVYVFLQ